MHSLKRIGRGGVKAAAGELVGRYRRATWRGRPLPDLVIVGAQKAGTSSLFAYLSQHPQLLPSYTKEVHFFDGGLNHKVDDYQKGAAWYRAHFPVRGAGARAKAFEASPLYMFNPLVPGRMFALMPEVKIVALLRSPTRRAVSHYFHVRRRGQEPLPIYEALRAEESRLAPALGREDYKSDAFIRHSYKSRGLYREQLERFLEYFPRRQLLVLCSEEFFARPEATLGRVFEFVGVDAAFEVPDLRPRNASKEKSEVEPKVYEYLDDYFRPHNKALYELLGEDYGW
ncbi:MAG TPA: sulfotransferase domain-containing protein [Pyrinomonadaceae bacterium]|jgi:hypothetical protein|nr:sulfotransferase domain-containing protein [Pyrinomonadaceae bacterium]